MSSPWRARVALIPDGEVERLKREVSVEQLARGRGVELQWHGADLLGLCPFHEDKEPSLVISPQKNLWHCLGACRAGGFCIDWMMKAEGISFATLWGGVAAGGLFAERRGVARR